MVIGAGALFVVSMDWRTALFCIGLASIACATSVLQRHMARLRGEADDLRRINSLLRASELHFRMLAQTTPGRLWICDEKGRRFHFNAAWTDFRGRTSSADANRRWLDDGVHPEDRAAVSNLIRNAIETRLPFSHEYRLQAAGGAYHWVFEHAKPRFDSDGTFRGFVGEAIDVTQRKQIEARLRDALRDAQAASRAKSAFLANTTHELRTPMTSILGFSELLLGNREALGPERTRSLELIHESGTRLLQLINDMLDLSRIEAGQMRVAKADCDVTRTIGDVVEMLVPQAHARQIDLRIVSEPSRRVQAHTDASRLAQIVTNLVGNAIKFTPERGRVTVSVEQDAEANVRIRISDTGVGIPPERRGELFKPFIQLDDSMIRKHGGTGLGLCISRGLAELLGGRIELESTPGSGSVFTLVLCGAARPASRLAA